MGLIIVVGCALVAVSVVIHGVGTTWWVRHLAARHLDDDGHLNVSAQLGALIATAMLLTALHLLEVLIWALAYVTVVPAGAFGSLEAALYFSAVTFTTLGYGDITLEAPWRLLSGIEAIDGILLIGWSTALMFAVLQRSWGSLASIRQSKDQGGSS